MKNVCEFEFDHKNKSLLDSTSTDTNHLNLTVTLLADPSTKQGVFQS